MVHCAARIKLSHKYGDTMSILSKILSRDKSGCRKKRESGHRAFLDFLEDAVIEVDELIRKHPDWHRNLPYRARMSPEEAREFEIEKRAIWRRVIYDAKRSNLPALRWETSGDERVCERCRKFEGRVYTFDEYDEINQIQMELGCRCNLVPVRKPGS